MRRSQDRTCDAASGGISAPPRARWVALTGIVVLAALLRLTALGSNPPGLFRDEAEKGYTAWSLARMGRVVELSPADLSVSTRRIPLFMATWGARTSLAYQWFAAPFVGLFGPQWWAIRAPAALAGIVTVVMLFFVGRAMSGDERLGLVAAALLAISPWHVLFSRWAAQGILVPLFMTAGIWLLQREGKGTVAARAWPLGVGMLCLAAYAYAPARLVCPLMALAILALGWHRFRAAPRWLAASAAIGAVIFGALVIYQIGPGSERLGRVSALGGAAPLSILQRVIVAYVSHFSPSYLFVNGDALPRHSLPGFGVLHLAEAPFFVLGFVRLCVRRRAGDGLILIWLLVSPLPAAIASEGAPHALRSLTGCVPASLISASGFLWILEGVEAGQGRLGGLVDRHISAGAIWTIGGVLFILSTALLSHTLFRVYPAWAAQYWQFGFSEAMDVIWDGEGEDAAEGMRPPVFVSSAIPWAPWLVMVEGRIAPERFREEGRNAFGRFRFVGPGRAAFALASATEGAWLITPRPVVGTTGPAAVIRPPGKSGNGSVALLLYRRGR